MMGLTVRTNDDFVGLRRLTKQQTRKALFRSGGYVRKTASRSIRKVAKTAILKRLKKRGASQEEIERAIYPASKPGTPPFTHTGQLKKAIGFAVDVGGESIVVGPKRSGIAEIGQVHEFGGEFRGRNYPARPFMRPARDKSINVIRENFRGMLTNNREAA